MKAIIFILGILLISMVSSNVAHVIINSDYDTLDDLSCANTEIAKWNSTSGAWECSEDVDTTTNIFDQTLNTTDSPTFAGLTLTGQLIMNALITSQDIIPVTDSLYSLGNSTHRFKDIYADNIDATTINTTNISSDKVNVSGYEIIEDGGNLVIKLT